MGHQAEGLSLLPVCRLCFLTVEAVTSCPLLLLPGLLHPDGLYHQTRSWKNAFFKKHLVRHLVITLEKVTGIGGKEEAFRSPAVGAKLWQ